MLTFEPLLGAVQALIDAQRIPGVLLRISRGGEIEVEAALGKQNPIDGHPMQTDTIFRIYSMTKPMTSMAIMMLIEEGGLKLDEPVTRMLPEFQDLNVGIIESIGGQDTIRTVPLTRVMTIRDLLRHTSGLTYGTFGTSAIKTRYKDSGAEREDIPSALLIERLAALPLIAQPASVWEYSRSTDVLGVIVERVSGSSLAEFFSTRILAPLGMVDTGFVVDAAKLHRVAEPFAVDPDLGTPIRLRNPARCPGYFSGGGGLFSTLDDYQRFIDLLRGRGSLGGVRLVSASSIDLMTRDHLGSIARGTDYLPGDDVGFGLGFAVRLKDGPMGHRGDYFWSGMAGTLFWIDPSMDLSAMWMMQAPNQRHETRDLFRSLVYQSYRS